MDAKSLLQDHLSRRSVIKGGAAFAVAGIANVTSACAATYPDRPVKIVVPFATGGAVDIVGRIVAQGLTDQYGKGVIVDNRSGAGGSIGTGFVAKSDHDGYTLLLHTVSSAIINAFLYKSLPYDPRKDLIPITEISASPTLVVINGNLPAKNFQEFVDFVKSKPGQYRFGSTGVGSSVHLDGQLFATRLGLDMIHVPYRGEGEAIKDLVAGETQMETGVASAFLPFIRSGQLRAICANSSKRVDLLPDVPTAAEVGLKDFELPNWYALYAPAGTPADICQSIYEATKKVFQKPDVQKQMVDLGQEIITSSPAELAAYQDQQLKFWEPVVQASGIKLDLQ